MAARQRGQVNPTTYKEFFFLTIAAAFLLFTFTGGIWAAVHLAARQEGVQPPDGNPIVLVFYLLNRQVQWPSAATPYMFLFVLLSCAVILAGIYIYARAGGVGSKKLRPDKAARFMASKKEIAHLTGTAAMAKAQRLGAVTESPGVPIGISVTGNQMVYGSWEDMLVLVAGPRTQKTTAYAIPACLAVPGACLVTSNKRDVVDATRDLRAQKGQIWIFDPQKVANEEPTWWWNPLTYVAPFDPTTGRAKRDPETGWVAADETKSEKLASQFVMSARLPGAKTDAYFDGEAENLIGLLVLAAACGEQPLMKTYTWLTQPTDEEPVDYLHENGFYLQEQSLYAMAHLPDKQRDGVYGTARSLMGFLRNRNIQRWITPPTDPNIRQFHPKEFTKSFDTLYPLSKEGAASAGPLVAALTVAVISALEEYATASPGGRLKVPFLAILDEAANICRFRNLDSIYSHFGSRGIIILTILQNWAQGEEVWGDKGMEKLWSAANLKIYGGGVDDDKFLRRLSDLVGNYDKVEVSESLGGKSGKSRSKSVQERTIMTIADLREFPPGRALVFASGTPPIVIKPQPWFRTKTLAPLVQASIDRHTPEPTVGVDRPGLAAGPGQAANGQAANGQQHPNDLVLPSGTSLWNVRRINE